MYFQLRHGEYFWDNRLWPDAIFIAGPCVIGEEKAA